MVGRRRALSEARKFRDTISKGMGLRKLNLQPDYSSIFFSFFLFLLKRERGEEE